MNTLVCLSGTFCDSRLWDAQIHALNSNLGAEYNYVFPSISSHKNIQELAKSILTDLPESFSMMGMSAGAVVALEILRQAPNRVEKLCIISGNASGTNPQMIQHLNQQLEAVKTTGINDYFKKTLLPNSLAPCNLDKVPIIDTIISMAHAVGIDAFSNQISMLKSRTESWKILKDTNIPVLAVCGDCDTICPPSNHQQIVDIVTQGNLVTLSNTGHYINIENPDGLNQALVQFFK